MEWTLHLKWIRWGKVLPNVVLLRELYHASTTSAKSSRCEEKYILYIHAMICITFTENCAHYFVKHGGPSTVHDWTVKEKRFFCFPTNHHGPLRMDHTGSVFSNLISTASQVSPDLRSFHNHPHHGGFYPARICQIKTLTLRRRWH